jgi:beta-xylosidase
VPADVTSFVGRDLARVVEPGTIELRLGASSTDIRLTAAVELTGPERRVDASRALHCATTIS